MPIMTVFVAVVLTFVAFAMAAYLCERAVRMFVAAFLSAGAWLSVAILALITWLTFRR
jgi:hypothetical protein